MWLSSVELNGAHLEVNRQWLALFKYPRKEKEIKGEQESGFGLWHLPDLQEKVKRVKRQSKGEF